MPGLTSRLAVVTYPVALILSLLKVPGKKRHGILLLLVKISEDAETAKGNGSNRFVCTPRETHPAGLLYSLRT